VKGKGDFWQGIWELREGNKKGNNRMGGGRMEDRIFMRPE
jgi:hypothetical protein